MVMLAVVRVPVLSEHSTFMEAISWRAVKCVTIAFFSAIVDAPIAMVTYSSVHEWVGPKGETEAKKKKEKKGKNA